MNELVKTVVQVHWNSTRAKSAAHVNGGLRERLDVSGGTYFPHIL